MGQAATTFDSLLRLKVFAAQQTPDTDFYRSHRPGPDAFTAAWQPDIDSNHLRVGYCQPAAAARSTVFVPGAGSVSVPPAGLQQQMLEAVQLGIQAGVQQAVAPMMQELAALRQQVSIPGLPQGHQQSAPSNQPLAEPEPQPQPQPQLQHHQPEPLADGTVHRLPSALYTAAMATVPQPEHEPAAVQELPKLGVYTSVQQICDAWFTGLDGRPPLKELPPEQRLPKQRWSDWGLFRRASPAHGSRPDVGAGCAGHGEGACQGGAGALQT